MKLIFKNNHFILDCGVIDSDLAKRAGFTFSRKHKMWATPFAGVAKKISKLAGPQVQALIQKRLEVEHAIVLDSSALWSDFSVPAPAGKTLYPFQRAGVKFLTERPNALLADAMGTGKTAQAIGAMNVLHKQGKIKNTLIICPASLKLNWASEISAWDTTGMSVDIAYSSKFPKSDIVIANYDILSKISEGTHSKVWDNFVMDECHYIKNYKAKRTKEVTGGFNYTDPDPITMKRKRIQIIPIKAKRKIALSGTVIVNRPMEVFGALKYLAPFGFPSRHKFGMRYCGGYEGDHGWEYKGASNLAELQFKLRSTIMIRRLKRDVLPQLPPKIKQIIELDNRKGTVKRLNAKAHNIIDVALQKLGLKELDVNSYDAVVRSMGAGVKVDFTELSTIRLEAAKEKLELGVEFIKNAVDDCGKVVVFCWHRVVIQAIAKAFGDRCVVAYGGVSIKDKHEAVYKFQNDPKIELFVGNLVSAGVGITLTAASRLICFEIDWVPGNVSQAEDRCHRIGQASTLLIQHLVLAGSPDVNMLKVMFEKQKVLDAVMDEDRNEGAEDFLC